jgi:hypothetical protein
MGVGNSTNILEKEAVLCLMASFFQYRYWIVPAGSAARRRCYAASDKARYRPRRWATARARWSVIMGPKSF